MWLSTTFWYAVWRACADALPPPRGGPLSSQIVTAKLHLIGERLSDYLAPSAGRLSEWIEEAIAASINRDTSLLTLTGESAGDC